MMKDGRAGHSDLTERPILNELRNTTVLDMAISLASPHAKLNIKDLGHELVTSAMDRMKVLGMGGFWF
jgi:hypothetical protein